MPVITLLSQETSDQKKTITVKTKFVFPKKEVSIFANNTLLKTSSVQGDIDQFILDTHDVDGNEITVRAYDTAGNIGELIIQ